MAEIRTRSSSFSRNPNIGSTSLSPGLKPGPNGSIFVSSGIPDLDKILGGGISLGSLVMVMEDPEAPHHMLLLRNFMAQGLIHSQSLLFASPSSDPRGFLGTLPKPYVSKDRRPHVHETEQEKNLRIAWQYKKYFDGNQQTSEKAKHEYCTEFDLRSPLERHALSGKRIECVSTQDCTVDTLLEHCSRFFTQNVSRNDSTTVSCPGRIAIQSLCSPQCGYYGRDWDMLSFIKSLKQLLRSSNAVAVITFPQSVLSPSFSKRWMHLADTLISTRAIPDDDKDLTKLLTGYQDMVGLLNVHRVARMNSQVPFVLEATTFSIKLHRRRSLVLECLNQAPVDGSSGSSYGSNCSSKTLDF